MSPSPSILQSYLSVESSVSLDQFIARAVELQLLTDDGAQHLRRELAVAGTNRPQDAAGRLVQSGVLTAWQGQALLVNQPHPLVLGQFRLLDEIGSGGMGHVYLAEHRAMRRRVAVKVFQRPESSDSIRMQRFLVEAQAAAQLSHPNIVQVLHYDEWQDQCYLVMEYVAGENLKRLVDRSGAVEPVKAAEYIRQGALGLACAHEHNIVHRDIKPSNLLLDGFGNVKLADLGLARLVDSSADVLTRDGGMLGTIAFIAPEQIEDSHNADHRADVYGLGCTLYYLLAGQVPFDQCQPLEMLYKHLHQQPPSLLDLRPRIPRELAALCMKMMAKNPADRVQTATEAASALAAWLDSVRDATTDYLTTPPAGRDDRRAALNALALGLAHRVNNLTHGVAGHVSLGLMEIADDNPIRSELLQIERAAARTTELTQQLLWYAGRGQLDLAPVHLDGLVDDFVRLWSASVPGNITMTHHVSGSVPPVNADLTQLRRVLANLVTNALEALGDAAGTIEIRCGPAPGGAFLEIADSGPGIDAELIPHVCDPFFSTKATDRGLGLSTALGIVEQHGGKLTVTSPAAGGTTVQAVLPALQSEIETKTADETSSTGFTILVADDEELVLSVVARSLSKSGITVLTASDGREAVEKYAERPDEIDAVILDMSMPFLTGDQVLARLRAVRPDVRALISSAVHDTNLIEALAANGPVLFIEKPYTPHRLIETVHQLLGK